MKLFEKFISLLYVPHCVGCEAALRIGTGAMCEDCRLAYLRESGEACPTCNLAATSCLCAERPLVGRGIKEVHKRFLYHATAHERVTNRALYRLKHKGDPLVLDFFAREIADMLRPLLHEERDKTVLTFAPRSRRAIRIDGFDHMELLAKRVARLLTVPFMKTLERRGGKEQKRLSKKERFLNMKNAYVPKKGVCLSGRKVMVIDDITTSGATLSSVISSLHKIGARGVKVAVLGATPLYARSAGKSQR